MKLICQRCKYEIAEIHEEAKIPLKGNMFLSRDTKHGVPAPWSPVVTWKHMNCPMCGNRPFDPLSDGGNVELLTDKGMITITREGITCEEPQYEEGLQQEGGAGDSETGDGDPEESEEDNENGEPIGAQNDELIPQNGVVHTKATEPGSGDKDEKENEKNIDDSPDPEPDKTDAFGAAVKAGEVVQKGSWFEYKGKNYRKDELIELLNG